MFENNKKTWEQEDEKHISNSFIVNTHDLS